MNATDKDTGVNAQLKFTIISGNDDGTFELNETSGELFTAKSLDYDEEPNSYKVRKSRTLTPNHDFVMSSIKARLLKNSCIFGNSFFNYRYSDVCVLFYYSLL